MNARLCLEHKPNSAAKAKPRKPLWKSTTNTKPSTQRVRGFKLIWSYGIHTYRGCNSIYLSCIYIVRQTQHANRTTTIYISRLQFSPIIWTKHAGGTGFCVKRIVAYCNRYRFYTMAMHHLHTCIHSVWFNLATVVWIWNFFLTKWCEIWSDES